MAHITHGARKIDRIIRYHRSRVFQNKILIQLLKVQNIYEKQLSTPKKRVLIIIILINRIRFQL